MKRLLLALYFLFGLSAFAANPSFQSFNTDQFDTTGNRIALKSGVLITNIFLTGSTNLLEVLDSDDNRRFYIDLDGNIHFSSATNTLAMSGGNLLFDGKILNLWTNISGSIQAFPTYAGTDYGAVNVRTPTLLSYPNMLFTVMNTDRYLFIQRANGLVQIKSSNAQDVDSQSFIELDPGGQNFEVRLHDYTLNRNFAVQLQQYLSGTNGVQILTMGASGQSSPDVLLDPSRDFGLANYILNARLPVSSGDLFEVQNGGTNVFAIGSDGTIKPPIPNQTNANLTITSTLTVTGTSKHNALSAMSLTVTNDVMVQGNYIGTIDPTVTGTTLNVQKSLKLQFPRYVDNAGCTYSNTNDYTALTFMLPQFSGTGATNANYCDFAFRVPADLDTSKDLTGSLTIRLTGADTSAHTYDVGMVSIANSGAAAGTPANFVALTISGDASGASGDIESVSNVTLTGWKSNMTAGQWCLLRLNRDGANDSSNVASNLMELEIFYWAIQ